MYVKIRFPTDVVGLGRLAVGQIIALSGREALPLIKAGKARQYSDLDEQLFEERKERARKAGQNVDWAKAYNRLHVLNGSTADATFASKLKSAVLRQAGRRSCEHHAKTRSRITPRARASRFRRLLATART